MTSDSFDVTTPKPGSIVHSPQADLAALVDLADAFLWQGTSDGGRNFFNATWLDFTGMTLASQVGFGWLESVHPDDHQVLRDAHREARRSRRPYEIDYRVRRFDGEWCWIEESARPKTGTDSWVGTCREPSELSERRDYQRDLLETVRAIVWRSDVLPNKCRYISPRAETVLGYPRSDWIEVPDFWIDHLHPDDRERTLAKTKEHIERCEPHDLEYRMIAADGSVVWFHDIVQFVALDGRHGEIAGVMIDITERMKREAEKARFEKRLRRAQKRQAVGTLAGGIAHDFNNILLAMIGYTELAHEMLDKESPIRETLDQVMNATDRAKNLVRQILLYTRGEDSALTPTDLATVTGETLRFLRASVPSTIELIDEIDPDAGDILADDSQLHQVIMNLCTNSIDAISGGAGRLTINVSRVEITREANPSVELAPGLYVRLSVIDDGHGMDERTIERIFDPFFTTRETGAHSGLGLSVVQGIVRSHRGAIAVRSRREQGTTVDVWLPHYEGHVVRSVDDSLHGTESILVVDDEVVLTHLAHARLAKFGYRVTCKPNGHEALTLLRQEPEAFDLVLTDQTMPGITGIELASAARAVRDDLPVILTTGFHEAVTSENVRSAGVSTFITKPYTGEELARAVRRTLDAYEAERSGT